MIIGVAIARLGAPYGYARMDRTIRAHIPDRDLSLVSLSLPRFNGSSSNYLRNTCALTGIFPLQRSLRGLSLRTLDILSSSERMRQPTPPGQKQVVFRKNVGMWSGSERLILFSRRGARQMLATSSQRLSYALIEFFDDDGRVF